MKLMKRIVVLLSLVALVGCANNLSSVREARQSAGVSMEFDKDIGSVKSSALASMDGLNINIVETYQNMSGFNILFTKSMSAWSHGEVGRVLIYENKGTTTVSVHAKKRSPIQITGTDEQGFASAIFEGIKRLVNE